MTERERERLQKRVRETVREREREREREMGEKRVNRGGGGGWGTDLWRHLLYEVNGVIYVETDHTTQRDLERRRGEKGSLPWR